MNSKGLARHYTAITPQERLPLLLAAIARGDELERSRLADSAPLEVIHQSDYYDLAHALCAVAERHLLNLLDLAAQYWRLLAVQADVAWICEDDDAETIRLDRLLGMLAHLMLVHAEAWGLFCAGLKVDSRFVLQGRPGFQTAEQVLVMARRAAFSHEEASAWMAERSSGEGPVVTAASICNEMQAYYEELAAC